MKDKPKKIKTGSRKAAWTLVFLTPLIAELTFGSTPTRFAYLILLWLPIYGAGILLIRELVARTGRGWPSIILLGLAYELAEDGLGLQALTSPHLYHAADWAPQILGFNVAYWVLNIIYHIVFSAVIPIFITNLLFPAFKDKPYLKKGGLVWTAIFAVIGVGLLRISVPPSQDPGYNEPLALIIGYVVAIIAIGVIALRALPRKQAAPVTNTTVPSAKKLVAFGGASTIVTFALMYPFAGAHQPLFSRGAWAYVPIVAGAVLAVWAYKTVAKWSRSEQWNNRTALALASGALVGHTLFGFLAAKLQDIDRIGLAVMLAVMVWLLYRLYRKQGAPVVATKPLAL
jgi:hypothetical protein